MNSCWVSGVGLDFCFSQLLVAVGHGSAVVKIRNVCRDFSSGTGAPRGHSGGLMHVCVCWAPSAYVLGYIERVFISNGGLARSKEAI